MNDFVEPVLVPIIHQINAGDIEGAEALIARLTDPYEVGIARGLAARKLSNFLNAHDQFARALSARPRDIDALCNLFMVSMFPRLIFLFLM